MKITLSGHELEDAISLYLIQQFGKDLTVSVDDSQEVTACCIELYSTEFVVEGMLKEKHIHSEQESEEVKPKRTRRKKVEVLDENDNSFEEISIEEEPSEEKTKYASLPKLNKEDQDQYTQILQLLNNNPRNKNRLQLEELTKEVSENLLTVLNASEHYQDWLKYCKEQDSEQVMNEILVQNEPVEETTEEVNLRLMKEVNEEAEKQENQEEKPKKSLFGSPDNSVNKSGSLFTAQPTRRVF